MVTLNLCVSVQLKVFAVGGKGVGKSTLLKFLINRILATSAPLLWIDLDPGQAEFTLPGKLFKNLCIQLFLIPSSYVCSYTYSIIGCISCTVVDKPLIGPNFTHLASVQAKSISYYVGSVSVSEVSKRYQDCVKDLVCGIMSDPELANLPWFVNSMGFSSGLGVHLLKTCAELINPTTVITIKSRFAKKNYETPMKKLISHCQSFMEFDAVPESTDVKDMTAKDMWGIPEPYKLRDIVILSYLGMSFKSSSLTSVTPYAVPLDSLAIQTIHCKTSLANLFAILNMSIVSLGHFDGKSKEKGVEIIDNKIVVQSKGFGVVRGISIEERVLYVLTSLSQDELKNINCFTVGTVQVPNGVYMLGHKTKAKHNHGKPYLSRAPKENTPLNTSWQRSTKPHQNIHPQ